MRTKPPFLDWGLVAATGPMLSLVTNFFIAAQIPKADYSAASHLFELRVLAEDAGYLRSFLEMRKPVAHVVHQNQPGPVPDVD